MRKITVTILAALLAALALALSGYRWELAPMLPWDYTPEQAGDIGGGVMLPWDYAPEVDARSCRG